MIAPAAGQGFDLFETFDLGVLFVGVAVFAAVGALSHQHERAFSASLIYLGLVLFFITFVVLAISKILLEQLRKREGTVA